MVNANHNSSNALVIDESQKMIDNIRTYISKMNARPDSITKTFSKQIRVNIDTIDDLNRRIREKIQMHCSNPNECITKITITYDSHRSYDFDTWAKFIQMSRNRNDHVVSITLKWDFLVNMPQFEMPQPHSMVVKISSGLTFHEYMSLLVSGKIEDVNDVSIMDNIIVSRIEFINTLLGEELLNVVSEWVNTCPKNNVKSNRFILFLRKYRRIITSLFVECIANILVFVASFFTLSYYIYLLDITEHTTISEMKEYAVNLILICGFVLSFVYLAKKGIYKIAQTIYVNLSEYGQGFVFDITTGDRNRIKEAMSTNKQLSKSIFSKIFGTFLLDFICSFIISYILGQY